MEQPVLADRKKRSRNVLNVADVCALIKQCSESGVKAITLGDLQISFDSTAIESLPEQAIAGQKPSENIEKKTAREEIENKEELLAIMKVADPLAYEKLMIAGELEDGRSRTESAV